MVDDGVEHTNADLVANYDPAASYDFNGASCFVFILCFGCVFDNRNLYLTKVFLLNKKGVRES